MSEGSIIKVMTDVEDINRFVQDKLQPALNGEEFSLVNASLLSVLLWQQGPRDMTLDELIEGIKGASGWIVTYLSSLRDESRPS